MLLQMLQEREHQRRVEGLELDSRRRLADPPGGELLRDWDSADERRAAIATWLHHYLYHRPHQALNWQTPIERRAERLAAPVALAA